MTAQLEALELQGYKTFANRTLFKFSEKITVIVGPNGSGKSNIADSIRWVLGEQSYRLLRGKKTEDMIFSGSEQRARSGMASVTITFDNSAGWLPIDFNEIAITRRAYRDGQNEYLINGQRMRLMDVNELLAKSGLGERTYTIIGQGLVDEALALRADERRRLFEEAAGIGLYRSRREEALRRLETTQRNIERVQDILLELKPRQKSLERQAERAQEFNQIRSDLQIVMREWYGYHWHHSQNELANAMEIHKQREVALEQAKYEQLDKNERLAAIRDQIVGLREELNELHRTSADLHKSKEINSRELAVIDERLNSYRTQIHTLEVEISKRLAEVSQQKEDSESAVHEVEKYKNEFSNSQTQLEESTQLLENIKIQYEQAEHEYEEILDSVSDFTQKEAELKVRLAEREIQIGREKKAISQAEENALELNTAYQNSKKAVQLAAGKLQEAENHQQEITLVYENQVATLEKIEDKIFTNEKGIDDLVSQITRIQAQIDVIDQAEIDLSGYAKGTQLILQAARTNQLDGVLGAFSNYMDVPAKYEIAIAAALGEFIDAVIVDSDPDRVLDMLAEQVSRGVILPKHSIQLNSIPNIGSLATNEKILGIASRLVTVSSEYQDIVDLLLSNCLIVADRKTAKDLDFSTLVSGSLKHLLRTLRIVTLQGEVYYPSGPITTIGSGAESDRQTILGRTRRRKELLTDKLNIDSQIEKLNKSLVDLRQEHKLRLAERESLDKERKNVDEFYEKASKQFNEEKLVENQIQQKLSWTRQRIGDLRQQLSTAESERGVLQIELSQLMDRLVLLKQTLDEKRLAKNSIPIEEHQSKVIHWKTINAVAKQAYENAERRSKELALIHTKAEDSTNEQRKRITILKNDAELLKEHRSQKRLHDEKLDQEILDILTKINPLEERLNKLERDQIQLQSADAQTRKSLTSAEHQFAQARISLASKQEALESLRRRIEDDLGLVEFDYVDQVTGPTPLPFDGIVKHLPVVDKLDPEVEIMINRQRSLLRRIGPVNPEAQQEYVELNKRYNFLSEQIEDLEKAETDVRKVINELDELMERELLDTFNKVSVEFEKIFSRLFNGGSAHLILTDPRDMTNSGIEIEARLPGRRLQGLSLLSGGERSLTATALIFAILRVSPTPFCLLDEVDAMLDESNIVRFRELLEELSDQTQFVIVTHNRNTVQAAEIIYGVTMGRDSVSQVVSLKPDEVVKEFVE